MTMRQSFEVTDKVADGLKPYVRAMMGASGLNEFDATSSVLFAIATHIGLAQYPILVYLGARATGKSAAMRQLHSLCKDSKWIHGRTYATHRDAVKEVRTAFVDEADIIDNDARLTDLYTCRYLRETGYAEVNVKGRLGTWQTQRYDVFGATVMAKRTPIADVALRSRAIIIRTTYRLCDYGYTRMGDVSDMASSIVGGVRRTLSEIGEIDRVYQTWSSLLAIAQEFHMDDWKRESIEIQTLEAEALAGGQGYEPSDAILQALDILARDEISHNRTDRSVRISEVVHVAREEFALNLRHSQIRDEAEARGFEISRLHGYPVIKVRVDHLNTLLPE